MQVTDVPVLIVGGGGAGLSSAVFLGDLGVDYILIERHPSTSHLPKAHYLNQRTMEIYRQHGAADAVYAESAPRDSMAKIYWMTSVGPMDGVSYLEQDVLGSGHSLRAEYDTKGTTHPTNIPELRAEPILRRVAEEREGQLRFGHELTSLTQDESGVLATVRVLGSGEEYQIRASYVIAADAGKTIRPMLGIGTVGDVYDVDFTTVWITADFSKYIKSDDSVMRVIFNPATPHRIGGILSFGPTHWDRHSEEWGVGFVADPTRPRTDEASAEEALEYLNVDVPVQVNKISRWKVDSTIAEQFSLGRVFLVGDSAHQHPPTAGVGLNSGVQDAHNLAWKLALVLRGIADPALLDSYEAERKPVVERNTEWAFLTMKAMFVTAAALSPPPGAPAGAAAAEFAKLMADTPDGASRRAMINEVFRLQRLEYAAHDLEMGFGYAVGAVVDDGSPQPVHDPLGSVYTPTSRPGSRLPHAWLDQDGTQLSTHDLLPLGGMLLITDSDGQDWLDAARTIGSDLGLNLAAVTIDAPDGPHDKEGQWQAVKEIGAGGALLVRPDAHVAFRAMGPSVDAAAELSAAVRSVLGITTSNGSSAKGSRS